MSRSSATWRPATALSVLLHHLHGTRLQLRLCIKTPDTWFVVADLSVQREEGEGKIYDPFDASMDLNSLYSMLLLRDLLHPVDRTHQDNVASTVDPEICTFLLSPPWGSTFLVMGSFWHRLTCARINNQLMTIKQQSGTVLLESMTHTSEETTHIPQQVGEH